MEFTSSQATRGQNESVRLKELGKLRRVVPSPGLFLDTGLVLSNK